MELKEIVKKVLRYNKNSNVNLLEKAYEFSRNKLQSKARLSGGLWIQHYLDVANLAADLKMDDESISAALMHGIIARGDTSLDKIERDFGKEIASLVSGIDKLNRIKKGITVKEHSNEDIKKVLLAAGRDIRIILIKLCDKLANMRELEYLPREEQKKISKEVMEIYAPLAYRLGIGRIKSELEDLAFRYLEPKIYSDISKEIMDKRKIGQSLIYKTKRILSKEFDKDNIDANVYGRVKTIYSIYKKLTSRSYRLGKMHDIVALRIVTKTLDECYKVLKIVHNNFRPVQGAFKDYIATPKPNGYQSLHTSIYDGNNNIIEVQIRDEKMNEIAEEGIASHFEYKGIKRSGDFDKRLGWVKELVSRKEGNSNLDIELFSDKIFVFTPKGKMLELTSGSTPLDFAYEIHSDIGNKCVGAIVNRKIVPLKAELDNGDVVEIITSKNHKPSSDWLKFVKTSKARQAIHRAIKSSGKIPISSYSSKIDENKNVEKGLIYVENIRNARINLAKCCNPIPGDKITGKKASAGKINIHKINCNAANGRMINASWKEIKDISIELIVKASDRVGLMAEIMNSVASFGLSVRDAKGKTFKDNSAECSFKVNVLNLEQLLNLIKRINKISCVKNVYLGDF